MRLIYRKNTDNSDSNGDGKPGGWTRFKETYAHGKTKPQKPNKPKLNEPAKPKPVIVKTYQGSRSNKAFEEEAGRLAEAGYFVQSVTSKGQQLTDFKTKQSRLSVASGVNWKDTKSTFNSKDGGILVTFALTEERKAQYAAEFAASQVEYAAEIETFPERTAEYEAALAEWKANKPSY